jgi:hypothetical protein
MTAVSPTTKPVESIGTCSDEIRANPESVLEAELCALRQLEADERVAMKRLIEERRRLTLRMADLTHEIDRLRAEAWS